MPSNARPRVLFVDDDEDSRDMLSTLRRFSRMKPRQLQPQPKPYLRFKQNASTCICWTHGWPISMAFELCRRIRAFDRHTPILFFSGAAYEADKKRGSDAGADAYVIKPDLAGLLGSITQFVSPESAAA